MQTMWNQIEIEGHRQAIHISVSIEVSDFSHEKGKTPFEVKQSTHGFTPIIARSNSKMPDLSFIPDGNISLVRFIRSN
jgi:hypothetical protein